MRDDVLMSIRGLSAGYGDRAVLSNIDLDLKLGQFNVLIGANGSGKSTLLKTIAGLQKPITGEIFLKGKNLFRISPVERASILAFVSSNRINPWGLTVLDMVRMGRYSKSKDDRICIKALEDVGAISLILREVAELSDGELQRVQIARALAQEPEILLLDEPTSFLDLPRRRDMVSTLRRLARARSISMVLSLHDLDLATLFADRTLLIDKRGSLNCNMPEVLGLDGSIADAYSQSPEWDPLSTPIGPDDRLNFSVNLVGRGSTFLWTERALKRVGVHIDEGSFWKIRINVEREGPVWQVLGGGEKVLFYDLPSLVEYVHSLGLSEVRS